MADTGAFLVVFQECGCMSMSCREQDDRHDSLMKDIRVRAAELDRPIMRYESKDQIPPWECEKHKAERKARLRERTPLFGEES